MTNVGWGDPEWNYKYMKESYNKWKEMKTYLDKGPERPNLKKGHPYQPHAPASP